MILRKALWLPATEYRAAMPTVGHLSCFLDRSLPLLAGKPVSRRPRCSHALGDTSDPEAPQGIQRPLEDYRRQLGPGDIMPARWPRWPPPPVPGLQVAMGVLTPGDRLQSPPGTLPQGAKLKSTIVYVLGVRLGVCFRYFEM